MKSAENEFDPNENTDVETCNVSVNEQAPPCPSQQCEKTSSGDKSTSNNNSPPPTIAVLDSPSNTEKTEVMSSTSSHASLPGAIAVAGMRGSFEEDESRASPPPSEEVVDVEAALENWDGSVSSNHPTQCEDDTSVVRKQEPVVMETMIHAELVTPPVEALRVAIDEECDDSSQYRHHTMLNESEAHAEDKDNNSSKDRCIFRGQWGCWHWTVLVLLLLLLICSILSPLAIMHVRKEVYTFPYKCFRTTREILEEQVLPENSSKGSLVLVMCPGTRVNVGAYQDIENSDLKFVRGDYPLMVVREGVTIQCGLDGKRENNCIINGGPVQVITSEAVTLPDGSNLNLTNHPVDDMIIRGMTFTGEIQDEGVSVSLSHFGQNLRFEDCLWTDMTARRGLIRIREDIDRGEVIIIAGDVETSMATLGIRYIHAIFSNSVFQSIIYDGPLINVVNQKLEVKTSIFRDIRPSENAKNECLHVYSRNEGELRYSEGCASLLSCSPNGDCSLHESCVENVIYKGPGLVVAHEGTHDGAYNRTRLDYTGMYLDPSFETQCELARIPAFDSTAPICSKIFEESGCQIPS